MKHGNSTGVQDPHQHQRWRALQLNYCCKLTILDVCGGPGCSSGNSTTCGEAATRGVKSFVKHFAIFTRKYPKACNFIKKRLQHRCFAVKIAIFLRTPFLKNICERLLLNMNKCATWKKCNKEKLQHAKSATAEKCKTKTSQRVKVQHEIVQYKKECNTKKMHDENCAIWWKCNMEKVQHEKSATWKKCTMNK